MRKKNLRRLVLTQAALQHMSGVNQFRNRTKNAIQAILISEMNVAPKNQTLTRPNKYFKITKTGRILEIRNSR